MKTSRYQFAFLKSGSKQQGTTKFILSFLMLILLLGNQTAIAQNTSADITANNIINYSFLAGLAALFIGVAIYAFDNAISALKENGQSVEFDFPVVRSMAKNGNVVGVILLIVLLSGIIWAITYGG